MSKLSISIGDKAYRLWVRIDSTKPFSDDVIALVRKIKTNKKTSGHVRTLTETRIICTPPVFDRIQADLDVMGTCSASLFSQQLPNGKPKQLIKNVKMYGADKSAYDEMLRLLRY